MGCGPGMLRVSKQASKQASTKACSGEKGNPEQLPCVATHRCGWAYAVSQRDSPCSQCRCGVIGEWGAGLWKWEPWSGEACSRCACFVSAHAHALHFHQRTTGHCMHAWKRDTGLLGSTTAPLSYLLTAIGTSTAGAAKRRSLSQKLGSHPAAAPRRRRYGRQHARGSQSVRGVSAAGCRYHHAWQRFNWQECMQTGSGGEGAGAGRGEALASTAPQ